MPPEGFRFKVSELIHLGLFILFDCNRYESIESHQEDKSLFENPCHDGEYDGVLIVDAILQERKDDHGLPGSQTALDGQIRDAGFGGVVCQHQEALVADWQKTVLTTPIEVRQRPQD